MLFYFELWPKRSSEFSLAIIFSVADQEAAKSEQIVRFSAFTGFATWNTAVQP